MPEAVVVSAGSVESADGTKLAYRAWPKPGAATAFAVVHGLGEHAGRYARFAEGMAKHGMSTYALDLRGHGKSEGQRGHVDSWSQWTDDVSAFVRHVEGAAGGEVIPLGHSFGGAALLSTVLAGKLPGTKRFVLSSPALKLRVKAAGWKVALAPVASKVVPRLAMDNEVDPATVSRIPEVVEAYRNDPLVHNRISSRMWTEWQKATVDIFARASQIKMPFLVLAGTADPLVDPEGSKSLHERAKSASTLHLLEGRYHEPFNDLGSDEVFQLIADWVGRW
ncbi:MAG: alpha/beta hydrolase [Candidatus Dormibacteraceae bacterium]